MRHFRRLYFDNPATAGATESFVSVIDQGRNSERQPIYNIRVGDLSLPGDIAQIQSYVLNTSCFFKLPIGASAIVDIYAPDIVENSDPLSFDYQVFKAKKAPDRVRNAAMSASLANSAQSGAAGSSGPTGPTGPRGATAPNTGPTSILGNTSVSVCHYSGNCGGQSSVYCDPGEDPLLYHAVCSCNGGDCQLTCEPVTKVGNVGKNKQ